MPMTLPCDWGVPIEIIEIIEEHGLSLRKIPDTVTSCHEIRHHQEGDEKFIFTPKNPSIPPREMCRRTRVPEHAGMWLCQQIKHTNSIVRWDIKKPYGRTR
jgi:hypothetical protein